ncbi:hypothetical protein [Streptomyces sp. NPDC046985]|uniref:hypothetical protein n=1 Tax=Streptomyces sp. NPDC046985 TaxID=3155377 RepID=UPI0033E8D89E
MASKASSEAATAARAAEIPKLPGLGRSWYRRGALYWSRRVLTGVLWLLLLGVVGYLVIRLYQSFRTELPPAARLAWDCVQGAAACAALVWGWTAERRRHAERLLDPPTPDESRARRRERAHRNRGVTAAARVLWLIVLPVMPSVFAYGVGAFLSALTVGESAAEVGARRWLEDRRTGRRGE